MSGHATREELIRYLEERRPTVNPSLPSTPMIAWMLDGLEEIGLLVFDSPPMREPLALGSVVTASTRHSGERKFWTRFTNRERVHSTQCWIDERGTPATWADLVNPRPATHREP